MYMNWSLLLCSLQACVWWVEGEKGSSESGHSAHDGAGDSEATSDTSGGVSGRPECEDFEEPAAADVVMNSSCEVPFTDEALDPEIEWTYGSSSFCGPPAVGQLLDTNESGGIDPDDVPLVVIYQSGDVTALYGDSGGKAWAAEGAYGQDGGFAIGDLDDDGFPEVIAASSDSVCSLSGEDGTENWCTTGLGDSMDTYGYSFPSIADMDGTGDTQITVGNTILKANGSVLGTGAYGMGGAPYRGTGTEGYYGALSVPVDLDGDGALELVTGNAAYDSHGNTIWYNEGLDGLVAVADFDGDGDGEIVKTSGIYLYGLETDGSTAWGPITYSGNLGPPSIDDLDGDGAPEFVFAAQDELVAMEWGGATLWSQPINDYSGAAGSTFFDFDLDGYPEVLFADETDLYILSGLDGSVRFTSGAHASYTILETPIVADVDNDGHVEIVLGHCNGNGSLGSVTVYGDDDWPSGRKTWNQHAYYVTNIEDLGGVPATNTVNWPQYNNFRSGDTGPGPGYYRDLTTTILDICETECGYGNIYVSARLGNAGNTEIPAGIAVTLRAGVDGVILDVALTNEAIAAGTASEMLVLKAPADDLAGVQPVVTADEGWEGAGTLYECDETNNDDIWPDSMCD